MKKYAILAVLGAVAGVNAQVLTLVDLNQATLGTAVTYANGSGGGFGNVLGGGNIVMDMDASGLTLTVNNVNGYGNNVAAILFDSKAGGFTDATMNDTGDPGRRAISSPMRDSTISYAGGFLADYGLAVGSFGMAYFELTGGSLNFIQFNTGNTMSISRANLALGAGNVGFNWLSYLTSDTGFMSNESMPGSITGGNPGFNGQAPTLNFNRFEAVPEPMTMTVLGLGAAALMRRRKKA